MALISLRFSLGVLCLSLLASAPASAQNEGGPLPTHLVSTRNDISNARFFWCAGVTDAGDLDAYVAAGFDTLVVPLPWRTGEDGALFDTNFGPQRALASEGAKRGLQIVFSLPASPEGLRATRISADSPSYAALWTNWAQSAVTALQATPRLSGWMLPDDSRSLATFDDAGFRRYLSSHFASTDALNARWGTPYANFDAVSTTDVDVMVSDWKKRLKTDGNGALPKLGSLALVSDPNAAFAPAALSLADYKASSWKDLMSLWATTVRESDGRRPVFSGVCPDYAQLIAMPDGVDVSVAGVAPNVAEPDIMTHNPQAVDIARRGGTHRVVSRLSIQPRADWSASYIASLLPRWVDAALAHGARGVAFDSFDALKRNPVLAEAITATLKRVKAGPLDSGAPLATTAVLLEPLAEGASLHIGGELETRGLYGFGDGLVSDEPSNLVASLRWGTAFGSVDYLSPDDLASVDLSAYSTILAPQLLDCSPQTAQKLGDFMRSGGTFVADLGLGALQNGGSASALPPQMALLAGGIGPFELRQDAFNLRGGALHPLLPTWGKMLDVNPGMLLSRGEGIGENAFVGPVGFAVPPKGVLAVSVANGPRIKFPGADEAATPSLSVTTVERGYFVFAPFRLWSFWRPGQPGFDPLHGDILARGANVAVATDALTPFPDGTQGGTTRFPEIINRANSISLLNHDVNGTQNVALDTTGAGDWLWSNAVVRMLPPSLSILNGTRPVPIGNPSELESRPRALSLYTSVSSLEKLECKMRPIAVQNMGGGTITAQIKLETASTLALNVWGTTLQVAPMQSGNGWQPLAPDGTSNFRVTVVDSGDGYRCPTGSRHRITVSDFGVPDPGSKTPRRKNGGLVQVVVAGTGGRLQVEFSGAACSVQIEPDTVGVGANKTRAR